MILLLCFCAGVATGLLLGLAVTVLLLRLVTRVIREAGKHMFSGQPAPTRESGVIQ